MRAHNCQLGNDAISEIGEFATGRRHDSERVSLVDRYTDSSGRLRIKGNKNLKQSQSYPVGILALYGVKKVLQIFLFDVL